jgi:hypothetical protein
MHKTDFALCAGRAAPLGWDLWPGAEDKALRGRNLSAVFRTLYRQVGQTDPGLPSCAAESWRVENQRGKSIVGIVRQSIDPLKNLLLKTKIQYQQTTAIGCPFFRGKSNL